MVDNIDVSVSSSDDFIVKECGDKFELIQRNFDEERRKDADEEIQGAYIQLCSDLSPLMEQTGNRTGLIIVLISVASLIAVTV